MSASDFGTNGARNSLATTTNGQTKPVALVPTNNVTTKDGVTVRARIDPTLTVDDVVRQLCINLKVKDPPANYALRDETDELVTNDNLRRKIKSKVPLKYVHSSFPLPTRSFPSSSA
jgi:engulfment/cell motility protein 1